MFGAGSPLLLSPHLAFTCPLSLPLSASHSSSSCSSSPTSPTITLSLPVIPLFDFFFGGGGVCVCVSYTIFCLSPSVVPVWWLTVGDDFGAECWDGILDEKIEEHGWRMLGDPQVGVWSAPPAHTPTCPVPVGLFFVCVFFCFSSLHSIHFSFPRSLFI